MSQHCKTHTHKQRCVQAIKQPIARATLHYTGLTIYSYGYSTITVLYTICLVSAHT